MNFGLQERDITNISKALQQFPEIKEAILFGSRAMATFKAGSDIDIALKGEGISHQTLTRLNNTLQEELPIPYFFDLIDLNSITSTELLDHIKRVGITIYSNP